MIYNTTHEAYLNTLEDVCLHPDYRSAPRGMSIREKLNYIFTIRYPTNDPIVTRDVERNLVIANYTKKELALYDSCSNRVEEFEKASSFWRKIANEDGTINSAYGYLIWRNKSRPGGLTQWSWAKQSLIVDKDTRQAILHFNLPEHQRDGIKDFPCTLYANFLIRNDELHLMVAMRSNDLWLGLTFDLPFFCSLLDKMVSELKSTYPALIVGTYTHLANSMHVYERDIEKIKKAVGIVHD